MGQATTSDPSFREPAVGAEDRPIAIRSTIPDPTRVPDLAQVDSLVLSERPRSKREIVRYKIVSRNSGELKGTSVGFRTRHKLKGEWKLEDAKSFTLDTEEEMRSALSFIAASCDGAMPSADGRYLMLPIGDQDAGGVEDVLGSLSADGRAGLLVDLLREAAEAPELLTTLLDQASKNPAFFAEAAATLNLARYKSALGELRYLIETSTREQDFQELLAEHPWMFGSEYSELLQDRNLVRGSQQDFVLRRTADKFIEIVEIKTPIPDRKLFRFNEERRVYYAGPELAFVVGQVQRYIEELDADRLRIQALDGEDTHKVRAKIIVGRDVDDGQRQALRRFNGHLHRIEVLTFDQLSQIAGQVVSYLERLVPAAAGR